MRYWWPGSGVKAFDDSFLAYHGAINRYCAAFSWRSKARPRSAAIWK
jgi:hypothetical protein